jgi:hypothetical protein
MTAVHSPDVRHTTVHEDAEPGADPASDVNYAPRRNKVENKRDDRHC